MQQHRKGFTLIEILVVVAIIGILSAVVLSALAPSRGKAKDTRIVSDLNQVRVLAEVYYINNGNRYDYLGTNPPTEILALRTDIIDQGSTLTINATTGVLPSAYAAYSQLITDSSRFYCVDSTGARVRTTNPGPGAIVCPPAVLN